MKKRKLFIGLVTASLILSVCGCQNSDSETYTADEIIRSAYDINIDDYVKLSDYKSIKPETEKPSVITDDTVTAYIDHVLEENFSQYEAIEGGTGKIEKGQYVNADLDVSIDGESIDEESDIYMHIEDDETYGIEGSLIGHKSGDTVKTKKKVSDDDKLFSEYAGKTADYEIKVNGIYKKTSPTTDDLSDAFVKEHFDCDTVEKYRQQCLETLQKNAAYAYSTNLQNEILDKLKESSEIAYPDNYMAVELDFYTRVAKKSAEEAGKELDDYLTSDAGYSSHDEFEKQAKEQVKKSEDQALISMALAKEMKISISEDDFNSFVDYYIQSNNYADADAFYQAYGSKERVMAIFLEDQAMNKLKQELASK